MSIDVRSFVPETVLRSIRLKLPDHSEQSFLICLEETLKFLQLASLGGRTFLHGNHDIDDMWHELILETKFYQELNHRLNPNGFVHHTAISYKDYATKLSAEELHSEELSFLASYVNNFGDFALDRVGYWTTCADVMRRTGWTIEDLNSFCKELIAQAKQASEEYESDVHRKMSELVCAGGAMSPKELICYMRDYGIRNPFCCKFFSKMFSEDKRNYYQVVAALFSQENAGSGSGKVLDIACGEGTGLLAFEDNAQLYGVDVSDADLAVAREKLSNRNANLLNASAQELPFEDHFFDFAICNMALMLMNPLEQVLQEVSRVLRPGSLFVAVVPSGRPKISEVTQRFLELNNRLAKSYIPNFPYIGFGPGHFKTLDSITAAFRKNFDPNCELKIVDKTFVAIVRPNEAAEFASSMYWADLLPRSKKRSVYQLFYDFFENEMDENELVRVERTFSIVSVRKSSS